MLTMVSTLSSLKLVVAKCNADLQYPIRKQTMTKCLVTIAAVQVPD